MLQDVRNFGLTVGGVFAAIGALLITLDRESYPLFLAIGGTLLILAALKPSWLRPVERLWMAFSRVMAWLTTRMILAIIFYLVLTPIAFFLKFTKDNALELAADKSRTSYWQYREEGDREKSSYEKQF